MTHRKDAARDADVLGRWRTLAEQRLDYLTQLFESGRWRRFYGEVAFLENIREAKVAVETWRGLSSGRAAESVIRVTWPAPERPSRARPIEPVVAIAPEPEPIELPLAIDDDLFAAEETPAEPVVDLLALERALGTAAEVLDQGSIDQRYPLLRNTF
jgi:uncharacterized repeat protein (TIGR03809 family)